MTTVHLIIILKVTSYQAKENKQGFSNVNQQMHWTPVP